MINYREKIEKIILLEQIFNGLNYKLTKDKKIHNEKYVRNLYIYNKT